MIRVLFVCLGNICRSPMAEAVFREKVRSAGLEDAFEIDSAGTGSWHVGELPDRRTREVCDRHGCPTHHRARQVRSEDFGHFDHVIAMDRQNLADLQCWNGTDHAKTSLMLGWVEGHRIQDVPDPYYGDLSHFEDVYALLDEACDGLLTELTPHAGDPHSRRTS